MTENDTNKGREISGKIFLALIFIALIVAIFRVSWWSFQQTWEFTKMFDAPGSKDTTNSLAIAVLIQYGQNPALWWFFVQRKTKLALERELAVNKTSVLLKQRLDNANRAMWLSLAAFLMNRIAAWIEL